MNPGHLEAPNSSAYPVGKAGSSSVRLSLLAIAAALYGASCMQPLDTAAHNPPPEPDPSIHTTVITTPPIEIVPDDPTATTTDACVKLQADAHQILGRYCGQCHDQGPASRGLGPLFDFVLNDAKLVTATWGQAAQRFVIPGDPEHSVLFTRASRGTDPPSPDGMPPVSGDLSIPNPPRPTISDISVLHSWIKGCRIGDVAPVGTVLGAGGSGGMGSGGSSGGTGGSSGGTGGVGPATGTGGAGTGGAGTGGVGTGGASTGGAGGSGPSTSTGSPCAGLCQSPNRFTVPPAYSRTNIGMGSLCLETTSDLGGWFCGNMTGRRVSVNGQQVVNGDTIVTCPAVTTATMPAKRNGGYCFQVGFNRNGGGNAFFNAYP